MDKYIAKTFFGLEDLLVDELKSTGAEDITKLNRAVEFKGTNETMYRANLYVRTALRVLKEISSFTVKTADDLYKGVFAINWKQYFSLNDTFAIDAVVNSPDFNHSGFVALKAKDAIADRFRSDFGRRPDIDTFRPLMKINIHISNNDCTVLLDSSGAPLFKRGYRTTTGSAPLNEVLAAGMIKLTGWDGTTNFIDPMCGSGTLPIEAALIAYNIAPGSMRKEFAFERWYSHDSDLWEGLLAEANDAIIDKSDITIAASDKLVSAMRKTNENIKNAGLSKFIQTQVMDMSRVVPPAGGGIAIMNPPYGERITNINPEAFYGAAGDAMKTNFKGYDVWVISGDIEGLKSVGLRPSRKIKLFNGSIECSYRKFSIYEGSRKHKKQKDG